MACLFANVLRSGGTIVDTDPTGDRMALLDGTPRERISNRGGGYLRDLEVVPTGSSHVLRFRGPAGVMRQICLTDNRYVPIQSFQYHELRGVGPKPAVAISQLLNLLLDVLTVRCGDELDYALALDWYKIPSDDIASEDWANTTIGDWVHRGKYWYKRPAEADKLKECGLALVERLAGAIMRHPLLRDISAIAAAPGHDSKIVSFGARLADAVARTLGKSPLVRCTALTTFRTPAKSRPPADRAAMLHNQFACDENLRGQSLLIIDDVYSSGSTANETARALRAAGAERVACLCAVRTLRWL